MRVDKIMVEREKRTTTSVFFKHGAFAHVPTEKNKTKALLYCWTQRTRSHRGASNECPGDPTKESIALRLVNILFANAGLDIDR